MLEVHGHLFTGLGVPHLVYIERFGGEQNCLRSYPG